jgi:GTPase SAR1 family protein
MVIVEDLFEQEQLMADKSFARYKEESLDTSGVFKPLQRTLVQIPCPRHWCMPNKQTYDWICSKCHAPLEYGYNDHYIYCECGRCSYLDYDFKCKDPKHGSGFSTYNPKKLLALLDALQPFPELNILILGETGVGKSTFINAFINYLVFESLDEAMNDDKLNFAIPCSFAISHIDHNDPDGKFVQDEIKIGQSNDEHDSSDGHSATQKSGTYPIPLGNTVVRLIDTPGIGDTRGVEQDRENMANILSTLKFFPKLHGILILLKPNDSRLTVMFRFCIKELLTHLHKDAAKNMVFGFTNTRISNYGPGDTFKPLEKLLAEHPDVGISLSRHTVFCFDSESFRFLAAEKQGVKMDNLEDFRRSWKHSEEESRRLIQHFRDLPPHLVHSTLSLNKTRELITHLTKPMADITQTIETTIMVNEDNIRILSETRIKGDKLLQRLNFRKVVLEANKLDKPRTVCSDSSCLEYRDDGNGVKQTIYKTRCHSECYLDQVPEKTVGAAQLAGCAAFTSGICDTCHHHWMKHLHVCYELKDKTVTVVDEAIKEQLAANATDIKLKQTAIEGITKQIQNARKEHAKIQDAAARFGLFLKENSITPYNDAMLDYVDHQIRQEHEKVVVAGVSREKLDQLIQRRKEYEERIQAIKESINSGNEDDVLDEKGIERLVQELYALEGWGKNLRDVQSVATEAEEAAYRERPYAVTRRRNWVQAPKWVRTVATSVANSVGMGGAQAGGM